MTTRNRSVGDSGTLNSTFYTDETVLRNGQVYRKLFHKHSKMLKDSTREKRFFSRYTLRVRLTRALY